MASKNWLYKDTISADGRAVTRHLKNVSFILRNPKGPKASKSVRDGVHVTILLRSDDHRILSNIHGSDLARLTIPEVNALTAFVSYWKRQVNKSRFSVLR